VKFDVVGGVQGHLQELVHDDTHLLGELVNEVHHHADRLIKRVIGHVVKINLCVCNDDAVKLGLRYQGSTCFHGWRYSGRGPDR
jgi:hypothetical protein